MNLARLLNTAWMAACQKERWAFGRAAVDVAASQSRVLGEILRNNADTDFGRRHNFARIRNPREYQEHVPLCTYDGCQRDIERIAAGAENVLTRERVRLLQPTSGTTSGDKLIPYTKSLQRQYRRCVAAWIGDLFRRRPAVRRGRAYWSISPAFDSPRTTAGGLRIGFDDDAAYLGGWQQWCVRRLLAVPAEVARINDLDTFRYLTLLGLIAAEDLALISVWSPTFLLVLLDSLPLWAERLADDLERGEARPPAASMERLARRLRNLVSDSPPATRRRRAMILREIARDGVAVTDSLARLWPQLALVSCWTDAAAAGPASDLHRRMPHVDMQPKGLLATEGCVSFPLVGQAGAALAIRSGFFEFQPLGADGVRVDGASVAFAHELEVGGRYSVVLTNGGGLYRYQLGDMIEVVGRYHNCPLVRFLGKLDRVSDLVGEKLAEPFVRQAIEGTLERHGMRPRFALLAPDDAPPRRYRLFLQFDEQLVVDEQLLALDIERRLHANPHYAYAVRLGQLAPVEVTVLDAAGESAWIAYERRCLAAGQKLGDIKPAILDGRTGWRATFERLVQGASGSANRS